jgi:hypothetical protein
MALFCERCGVEIEEIDGFDAMERGVESGYDYEVLCEECLDELEKAEDDEDL